MNKATENTKKDYRYVMGYQDGYQEGCAKTLKSITAIIERCTNPKITISQEIELIKDSIKEG